MLPYHIAFIVGLLLAASRPFVDLWIDPADIMYYRYVSHAFTGSCLVGWARYAGTGLTVPNRKHVLRSDFFGVLAGGMVLWEGVCTWLTGHTVW